MVVGTSRGLSRKRRAVRCLVDVLCGRTPAQDNCRNRSERGWTVVVACVHQSHPRASIDTRHVKGRIQEVALLAHASPSFSPFRARLIRSLRSPPVDMACTTRTVECHTAAAGSSTLPSVSSRHACGTDASGRCHARNRAEGNSEEESKGKRGKCVGRDAGPRASIIPTSCVLFSPRARCLPFPLPHCTMGARAYSFGCFSFRCRSDFTRDSSRGQNTFPISGSPWADGSLNASASADTSRSEMPWWCFGTFERSIWSGVEYLYDNDIAHRDLKYVSPAIWVQCVALDRPRNILFRTKDPSSDIVVTDFDPLRDTTLEFHRDSQDNSPIILAAQSIMHEGSRYGKTRSDRGDRSKNI